MLEEELIKKIEFFRIFHAYDGSVRVIIQDAWGAQWVTKKDVWNYMF